MEHFTSIPAIAVICYLAAEIFKAASPPARHKHIPALCGVAGMLLGMACYQWAPGYIPAENFLVAAAAGIVSGLSATGFNQAVKQHKDAGRG